MSSRRPIMHKYRGSALAWLLLLLFVALSVYVYSSYLATRAEIKVGENRCFPAHWCVPGTASVDQVLSGRAHP